MMRLFESIVQNDLVGEGTPDSRQYGDDIEDRGEGSVDSSHSYGEIDDLSELEEVVKEMKASDVATAIMCLVGHLDGKKKGNAIRQALEWWNLDDLIQPIMNILADANKSRNRYGPTTKIGRKHADAEKFHGVDNSEGLEESFSPEAIRASMREDGPTRGTTSMPSRWQRATSAEPGSATAGSPASVMRPTSRPSSNSLTYPSTSSWEVCSFSSWNSSSPICPLRPALERYRRAVLTSSTT